jgi:hypothetical protein
MRFDCCGLEPAGADVAGVLVPAAAPGLKGFRGKILRPARDGCTGEHGAPGPQRVLRNVNLAEADGA